LRKESESSAQILCQEHGDSPCASADSQHRRRQRYTAILSFLIRPDARLRHLTGAADVTSAAKESIGEMQPASSPSEVTATAVRLSRPASGRKQERPDLLGDRRKVAVGGV